MRIKGFQLLHYFIQSPEKVLRKIADSSAFNNTHYSFSSRSFSSVELVKDPERNNTTIACDFSDKLIKWAIQNNISHTAFSRLLTVLNEYGIENLPKNSKALLLAREERINISSVPPGTYTHFGLENNLRNLISILHSKNLLKQTDIGVSVFIDQLVLYKSKNSGLWVILGSLEEFKNIVFLIGAYLGLSRPKNSNLFLSKFVEEAKNLCTNGFKVNNDVYNLKISRLICDAPAKHFVLNIKSFIGYSSCTKCNAVGQSSSKKICFLEKGTLRTDEDFESNEIYQKEKTKLLEIPNFGVVSNVTLDYMHLVCLGVVKKLLSIWVGGEENCICMNSASELSKILVKIFPCEFTGKLKSIKYFDRWTANEFRWFLLYYGPIILKGNLKKENYQHFLLLHVACRLLCTDATAQNINLGRKLLTSFVEDYKKLYKEQQISYNFHGLYHLADECSSHGTLDDFSAFPFENFLTKLKHPIKKSKKRIIPQTVLTESYDSVFARSLKKITESDFKLGKKLKDCSKFKNYSQHEKMVLKNFEINPSKAGDKYLLLKNNKIIEVMSVLEKKEKSNKIHFVTGKEFLSVCNFHSKPYDSLHLDMFNVGEVSNVAEIWPVSMIDKKCMKVPDGRGGTVMVGLLKENF